MAVAIQPHHLALAVLELERQRDQPAARETSSDLASAAGFPPDPWQHEFLISDEPQILLNIHRQAGKSTTAAIRAIHGAMTDPGTLTILLSPGLRQSGELFAKCIDVYRKTGQKIAAESQTALTLRLVNGSRIVSLPGNEATVRGYSAVRRLIIDEAAHVPDALYRAVRPMLAVSGGQLIAMSTPWGKRGWWYEAWESDGAWQRFKVTADQCARISPEFLIEERRSMPSMWFDQEYMGIFGDMQGQIFPTDLIMSAFDRDVPPLFDLPSEEAVFSDDLPPLWGVEGLT